MIPAKGGNIRESIPDVLRFRTDGPEGESCELDRLGRCGGRTDYVPDSSRRSEQLSCRKHFHPSYGLKDMNFQRLFEFLELFEFSKNEL